MPEVGSATVATVEDNVLVKAIVHVTGKSGWGIQLRRLDASLRPLHVHLVRIPDIGIAGGNAAGVVVHHLSVVHLLAADSGIALVAVKMNGQHFAVFADSGGLQDAVVLHQDVRGVKVHGRVIEDQAAAAENVNIVEVVGFVGTIHRTRSSGDDQVGTRAAQRSPRIERFAGAEIGVRGGSGTRCDDGHQHCNPHG